MDYLLDQDLEELIAGIRKLGNNSEMRKRISMAARETTEKRFDKNRMVKETLQILETVNGEKD